MKKKAFIVAATCMLAFCAFTSLASTIPNTPPSKDAIAAMTTEQKQARVNEINQRIEEIRAMDKSQLSHEDRKALRAELKSDRQEARMMGASTYVTIGAIVVVILLLLLLL
jgi:hypothetical protein